MEPALIAIAALIGWGTGDLFFVPTSRRHGPLTVAWISALCGFAITIPLIPANIHHFAELNGRGWTALVVASLLLGVMWPVFMLALKLGPTTVVGTVAGSFAAITVVLSVLLLNEHLTGVEMLFIVLTFVGVADAVLDTRELRGIKIAESGIVLSVLICVAWGISWTLLKVVADQAGWFVGTFSINVLGIAFMFCLIKRQRLALIPARQVWPLIVIGAVLVNSATLLTNYALTLANASIVTPITGAYPALFALLSYLIFKDRMTRRQIVGVVITLVGIVGLSISAS